MSVGRAENFALFVPVLAASSSHAQNADWGGHRAPTVLAAAHPRRQAPPPSLLLPWVRSPELPEFGIPITSVNAQQQQG